MPKAPIRTRSPHFDAETAIAAALAALQKLDVKQLDPETSTAIGNALTALANDKQASRLYASLTGPSGTAAGSPLTGATLPGVCISVQRLCAETNWSKDMVYDLLNAGELEGFTIGGRRFITSVSVRGLIARRIADPAVIRYPNPLARPARVPKDVVKPPSQRERTPPDPPREERRQNRRDKRQTEPIEDAA